MELVTRATSGRPPGHKPAPKHPCRECHAPLSQWNPSNICSECNGGEWELPEPTEDQLKQLRAARLEELEAAA